MNRRGLLVAPIALAGASFAPLRVYAQTAQFIALRTWSSTEYTRIALEFDGVLLADQTHLHDESNLVGIDRPSRNSIHVDLLGLALSDFVRAKTSLNTVSRLVTGISAQPIQSGTRLSIHLVQAGDLELSIVPAVGTYRQRLLLDIYPAQTDLVEAWLARQGVSKSEGLNAQSTKPALNHEPPKRNADGVNPKKIVVIDAGHGGEDPGAIGPTGIQEKDITLALAIQFAKKIKQTYGWTAVLTRDADYFVPLAQRVKKARAADADLLVSIHADAFFTPKARGASVYALSENGASSAAAKWLAGKENQADIVGGLNLAHRDKQLASVLLDLSTSSQIRRSKFIGAKLLKQLGEVGHLHKQNVEQASFAVLKAPDVPSLLIETAFISHPEEEQLLTQGKYQARIVDALTKGLKSVF